MPLSTSWFHNKVRGFIHKFSYEAMSTGRTPVVLPPGEFILSFRNRIRNNWIARRFGNRSYLQRRHCDSEAPTPGADAK